MPPSPPRLARLLLRLLPRAGREYVSGDLEEEYRGRMVPERGQRGADSWFWGQVLRSLVAFARHRSTPSNNPFRRQSPRLRGSLSDLRFALRILTHRPGFAAVTILTLGVGIGAATSVFSAANWILYRPVPGVVDPERLALVEFRSDDGDDEEASYPNLMDLEEGAPGVAALAGHAVIPLQASAVGLEPRVLRGEAVTGGYFELLGVTAALGRLFSPEELDVGSESAVAVLGHGAWVEHLGSDPDVLGRTVGLNGGAYTIVGVAAHGFAGTHRLDAIDVWVPGAMLARLRHYPPDYTMARRDYAPFETVARLAPGVSAETAEGQLRTAAERIVDAHGEEAGTLVAHRPRVFEGIGLRAGRRAAMERTTRLFYWVVSFILLIACANVANLLLLRSTHRQGTTAVRRALGASRVRVALLHLGESVALAVPAATVGVLVAIGLNRVFWTTGFLPTGSLEALRIDGRVLAFALALGVVTTLVFGLFPAMLASRVDVAANLRGNRFGTRRAALVRGGLTVVQLSLCLALVVGTLLLGRTLWNLQQVELGFRPEGVTTFEVHPGLQGYSPERIEVFHRELLAKVRSLPSVRSASMTVHAPFSSAMVRFAARPAGESDREGILAQVGFITDDYFETLGVPVLLGRPFRQDELRPDGDMVILGETAARRLLGDRSPVDATISASTFRGARDFRVIGVVQDARDWELRGPSGPTMYLPFADYASSGGTLLVVSPEPPDLLTRAVRDIVAGVDPTVPVFRSEPLADAVARRTSDERTLVRLVGLLAGLAAALAGVGLYAVVAHAVAERTREIGIRIAVGADSRRVVVLIARHAAMFGGIGVVVGVFASAGVARALRSRLYGVEPFDPVVFGAAALLLGVVVIAASVVPARSAARIDPMVSLRVE